MTFATLDSSRFSVTATHIQNIFQHKIHVLVKPCIIVRYLLNGLSSSAAFHCHDKIIREFVQFVVCLMSNTIN